MSFENVKGLLDDLKSIITLVFDNAQSMPTIIPRKESTLLFNSKILEAAIKTIESIEMCLAAFCFSDAFVLLRKLRDDLMQFVYMYDNSKREYEKTINSIDYAGSIDFNNINENVLIYLFNKTRSQFENKEIGKELCAIIEWILSGDVEMMDKIFRASIYKKWFKNKRNTNVSMCYEKYFEKDWGEINCVMNNYTHGNGDKYASANLAKYQPMLIDGYMCELYDCCLVISNWFVVLTLLLLGRLMLSCDYIDCMENGLVPPKGCENWAAPIVEEYLAKYIKTDNLELYDFILANSEVEIVSKE